MSAPHASTMSTSSSLAEAKGFIFDMDGVLYTGSRALPGVKDLFNTLRLRDIPFFCGTNNSTATQQEFSDRLATMGIEVGPEHIQTSSTVTRDLLADDPEMPADARILVVGQPSIATILQQGTDFRIVGEDDDPATANVVVVGLDFSLTYDRIARAVKAIASGARFFCTNRDDRLPTEDGFVPGAGACVAPIQVASRVEPIVVGKPEPLMMLKGIEQLGCEPKQAVMVGDRLDTDIAAGQKAGMTTVLVLTGLTTRDDLSASSILPDLVFPDLPTMLQDITGHG